MAYPDINPILAAAGLASSTIDSASMGIQTADKSRQDISDADASLQLDIGANTSIINQAKNAAELSAQTARQKIGAITGTDANLQGEQITSTTATINSAYQQRQKALKNIQAKQSVGFMDNPLEYIMNQFTLNDDIRAHNTAADIEDAATDHLRELNALADGLSKTQDNFKLSVTQAAVDAANKNVLNTAQLLANKSTLEGLGYNIDSLKESIDASVKQLQVKSTVLGSQESLARLGLSMQEYQMHKEEFQWKKDIKDTSDAADDALIDRIQKGLTTMYGANAPQLSASPKLAKQYLSMLKMGGEPGKEATTAYMAGQTGILAGTPAGMIDIIHSGVGIQFTPAQQPIKQVLEKATQELQGNPMVTKENYKDLLNKSVVNKISVMQQDINPSDSKNIFNIGAVSDLIKMPGVSNTALAQKVLAPAVVSGATLSDPNQVYTTTLQAIRDKKVSISDAADGITALYTKGTHTNIDTRQILKFGIVPDENFYSYKTNLQVYPNTIGFGGSATIDMTNSNDVKRALMKSLAREFVTGDLIAPR